MPEIKPGHIIQGPRSPEPVELKLVEDLGDYIHLVGATTGSGEHVDQLIQNPAANLQFQERVEVRYLVPVGDITTKGERV
jgi:hypothetical protein